MNIFRRTIIFTRNNYKIITILITILGVISAIITIYDFSHNTLDESVTSLSNDIKKIKEKIDELDLTPQQQNEYLKLRNTKKTELKDFIENSDIEPEVKKIILERINRSDLKEDIIFIKSIMNEIKSSDIHVKAKLSYALGILYYLDLNLQKSHEWFKKAISLKSPELKEINLIADILIQMSDIDEAIILISNALKNENEKALKDYFQIAKALNSLGSIYLNMNNVYESIEYFEKALNIIETNNIDHDISKAFILDNLSNAYGEIGEYHKSLKYSNEAIIILKEESGFENPELAVAYNNLALKYLKIDDIKKAVSISKKAVIIMEKYPNHYDYPKVLDNYGMLCRVNGDLITARKYSNHALISSLDIYGENHITTGTVYNNLGLLSLKENNPELALSYFQKTLNIDLMRYGNTHPYVFNVKENIAETYIMLNQKQKAKAVLLRMIRDGSNMKNINPDYLEYLNKLLSDCDN